MSEVTPRTMMAGRKWVAKDGRLIMSFHTFENQKIIRMEESRPIVEQKVR